MSHWKGMMLAVAIDLVWITACPILATEPELPRYVDAAADVDRLNALARVEDSLIVHIQQHPEDVAAMERLATLRMEQGWHDAAIGPLARALQLDPSRRTLWAALDRALEQLGIATITDAELTQRARDFKETVEMWGHGC